MDGLHSVSVTGVGHRWCNIPGLGGQGDGSIADSCTASLTVALTPSAKAPARKEHQDSVFTASIAHLKQRLARILDISGEEPPAAATYSVAKASDEAKRSPETHFEASEAEHLAYLAWRDRFAEAARICRLLRTLLSDEASVNEHVRHAHGPWPVRARTRLLRSRPAYGVWWAVLFGCERLATRPVLCIHPAEHTAPRFNQLDIRWNGTRPSEASLVEALSHLWKDALRLALYAQRLRAAPYLEANLEAPKQMYTSDVHWRRARRGRRSGRITT